MSTKKSRTQKTLAYLEKLAGGPVSFGEMVRNNRECDGMTQVALAKKLKISRQNLCDIEKGRQLVSVAMAAKIAKVTGYSKELFVTKAIEQMLKRNRLDYRVHLEAA